MVGIEKVPEPRLSLNHPILLPKILKIKIKQLRSQVQNEKGHVARHIKYIYQTMLICSFPLTLHIHWQLALDFPLLTTKVHM